jgi:predicted Zn-ribbon and HTH transcriptional regulator
MNEATLGGYEGVTGWVPGFSHKGVEAWVLDPVHIEPAKKFLDDEMKSVQVLKDKRVARRGIVAAVCEECGNSSEWPASAMGTTEQCPNCKAHMDVPDPDDDWADLDVGVPEDGDSPA